MTDKEIAEHTLSRAQQYPYDASWDREPGTEPPAARDWAHMAARGIMADLSDRGGIKHEIGAVDEDVRSDIVEMHRLIILTALCTEDLEDDIEQAISDSFDIDWTARDGARAVIELLRGKVS